MKKLNKHNPCLLPRFLLGSVFWLSLLLPLFIQALQAAEKITYYHYNALGSPVGADG